MVTKNMAYDHPAYIVPHMPSFTTTAGAAGVGAKFIAFTTTLMKSATVMVQTAGTVTTANFNDYTFFKVNGTSTTSVGYSGNLWTTVAFTAGTQVPLTGTLSVGEMLCAKHGTDATQVAAIGYELLLSPGANVTV